MEPNELITQLYVGYYNRAPDPEGLQYWLGRLAAGVSLADIADSFAASPEAISNYPYLAFPDVVGPEAFLRQIYLNLFNRDIDDDGLEYYTDKLESGATTPGQIIAEIQANANTNPNNTDGTILANKVEVGLAWAQAAASTPGFVYNPDGATGSSANSILDNVTAEESSVTAALTEVDNFFEGVENIGDTFTLTTGIDAGAKFTGGTGNDTFIGDNNTVSAADQLNGGAGNDTFQYFTAAAAVVLPQLSGVENLVLNGATATTSLDVSGNADLETVTYQGSAFGAADLTGIVLNGKQTLGFDAVTQDAAQKVDATVGATTTAASLNVANGTNIGTVNLDGAAVTSVNIASSGSKANTIDGIASTGNEATVNVTGNQKLTITDALAATVKTVDASANTGGLVVTAGNADVKFTGGAGNDSISFAATQFTVKDVVNGGAGRDTVVINDTALTADLTKAINALAGVEVLGFGTAAGGVTAIDVDTITSVSEFAVVNTGTNKFSNASTGDKFFVTTTAGVAELEVSTKTGETVATVALDNQAATAQTLTTLDIDGASTINIASTGKAGNVITNLEVADNSNIVITGGQDVTITNITATATGHKVDASALTGKLDVAGTAFNDIIIGGAGNDTVRGTVGDDTITLGAGNNTVVYSAANQSGVTLATADQITDWAAGSNKIDLSGFGGGGSTIVAQNTVQAAVNAASPADFAAALAAAATVVGADAVGAFQYNGNTYVLANENAGILAGDDLVVELTGLQTLTADNFIV